MKNIHTEIRQRHMLTSRLLRGTALVGLAAMSATAALAQPAAPSDQNNIETVVVTGTSIKGAAPVGANVITVDRDTIEATGSTTIQSLLVSVPEVTGFGNAGQGGYGSFDGSGSNAPTIHSLGASASNSTLILVDSQRLPLSGLSHTLADPSTIPTIALERVEVLPDGASSIYGSDAVAGVLNFITRKNYQGSETDLEYGEGLDYNSVSFGQLLGTTWDKGSVMLAYNFVGRSQLAGTSRSFVNDNQSFRGLSNQDNFACAPATVSPTSGVGAGLIYASPYTAGAGITNSSSTGICGQTRDAALLPAENRNAALVSVHEELTDWLSVSSDLNWSNRVDNQAISRGTVTATAFGPGSANTTQINPFYVGVPGSTATSETVRYDFNSLFGPGAHTKSGTQVIYGTLDFEVQLPGDWTASLDGMAGGTNNFSRSYGTVCTACAYLAINGTTNSGGSLTASSNPVTLSTTTLTTRPLSVANADALNVWGAAGSAAAGGANTSAAVLTQLLDNDNFSQTNQNLNDINLRLGGSLFDLPAGAVKTSFGAEYRNQNLTQYAIQNGNGGPSVYNSSLFQASFGRSIYAFYAEFLVPLVGTDANIPLVHKLDLDVSGRYDHYSDFGGTQNPRVAVDWEILDGLKARGSYGTSFVAPALTSTGGAAGLTTEAGVAYSAGTGGPATIPAGYANNGGGNVTTSPTFCAAGCVVGNSSAQGILVTGPGGPTVKPEIGLSYSAGLDIDTGKFISALDGLTANITYWQTKYVGAITSPIMTLDAQLTGLNKNLIVNPSDAQIAAALNSGRRVLSVSGGQQVTFIQYYVQQNAFNLWANGIDFAVHYNFSLPDMGDFLLGLDGSEKLRFDQQNGGFGAPIVSNLNKNANTTFSSLALTARGSIGWRFDPFAVDMFINYTNPYYEPPGALAFYYKVPASVTVDLNLAYNLPSTNIYLAGTQIYVNAQNIGNQPPEPYNAAVGYDTTDASPLGRLISFGLRKKF